MSAFWDIAERESDEDAASESVCCEPCERPPQEAVSSAMLAAIRIVEIFIIAGY